MKLTDLTPEEQLAFLGMAKWIIRADDTFSKEEQDVMASVVQELTGPLFRSRMQAATARYKTLEAVLTAADLVERPEARELIVDRLTQIAAADGVDDEEFRILHQIKATWKLEDDD